MAPRGSRRRSAIDERPDNRHPDNVPAEQSSRSPAPGESFPPTGVVVQEDRQADLSTSPGRFGVRLAGLPVVFPAGEMLEYLPEVTLWRMPLAPVRMAGLMQLRGHPVPVFDAGGGQGDEPPARAAVLVVGDAAQAVALIVESAPEGVELGDAARTGDSAHAGDSAAGVDHALGEIAASVSFRTALGAPLRDRSGQRWWPVSPVQLFESLAGEERHG